MHKLTNKINGMSKVRTRNGKILKRTNDIMISSQINRRG